jgi:hypothetical protein
MRMSLLYVLQHFHALSKEEKSEGRRERERESFGAINQTVPSEKYL